MTGTPIEAAYVAVPVGRRDPLTGRFDDEDWMRMSREAAEHWDSRLWSAEPPGTRPR